MISNKAAMNVLRGAQNKRAGDYFENIIKTACLAYESEGTARIEKTPEPFHVIGSLGQGLFKGYFEKAAQPDFKGCLKSGQCIVFDAKHTKTDKLMLSCLSTAQKDSLIAHERLGAVSGVLISYDFRQFAFIPIRVFLEAKARNNHLYWSEKETAGYRVKIDCNGYLRFLDWSGFHNV